MNWDDCHIIAPPLLSILGTQAYRHQDGQWPIKWRPDFLKITIHCHIDTSHCNVIEGASSYFSQMIYALQGYCSSCKFSAMGYLSG